MIWDEFLRHFRLCDEEDSGLSDEEQKRKGPKNRPKHTRKRIHQNEKNFLEKFKTVLNFTGANLCSISVLLCYSLSVCVPYFRKIGQFHVSLRHNSPNIYPDK
ncbi:hypothetical protein [Bacteroides gallinaceum]|uniref:hypothetical protein n=1 Tax=Bacteroides gallinaceum TaxID=1462571 RepID=UPI0025AAC860|nr:hypothetical protein [Bacteroides gallinaceum]MDN0065276.1 hypothetical protein [Bacteroides gallinaceum]